MTQPAALSVLFLASLAAFACSKRGSAPPPSDPAPMPVAPELEADAGAGLLEADAMVEGQLQPSPDVPEQRTVSSGLVAQANAPSVDTDAGRSMAVNVVGKNSTTSGTVTLRATTSGVELTLQVAGVSPPGPHGVHLHERADCSAADASSAGDHWNPDVKAHGMPKTAAHHLGDLGNIMIAKDGTGTLTAVLSGVTLDSGNRGLVGRALVVHAKRDDGKTQPSGASGDRIGCAEIK